jgi:fluoride exporter
MLSSFAAISIGATAGALLRYGVALWSAERWGDAFPWGTLLVNGFGSLVVGCFLALAAERPMYAGLRLLIATGFCGSLTTFSTFGYETVTLAARGAYAGAAANIIANLLLSLAAVAGGSLLARLML